MSWLDWVFIAICAIWISEFLLFPNRQASGGETMEKKSFISIFLALGSTIVVALLLREFEGQGLFVQAMQGIGIILFTLGVFLRFWGILHLKTQFTRNVTVQEGDEIVSTGPYRILRHPLYTALLFIGVGMALYLSSIIAAVIGGSLLVWTLLNRIDYEEQLLIEKFGPEYEQWMSKRARLIPYVY